MMTFRSAKSVAAIGLIALLVNTGYVAAFASPTIFYMANVLGHVALGIVVSILGFVTLARQRELRPALKVPAVLFAVALAVGLYLMVHGNLADDRSALRVHVAVGILAVAALAPSARRAFAVGGSARARSAAFAAAPA